jgi:hypothetical protein
MSISTVRLPDLALDLLFGKLRLARKDDKKVQKRN